MIAQPHCNMWGCLQHFRERLYLTDKPRIYNDARTAEERKYPQLFLHRQQGPYKRLPAFLPAVMQLSFHVPKLAQACRYVLAMASYLMLSRQYSKCQNMHAWGDLIAAACTSH